MLGPDRRSRLCESRKFGFVALGDREKDWVNEGVERMGVEEGGFGTWTFDYISSLSTSVTLPRWSKGKDVRLQSGRTGFHSRPSLIND